MRWRAAQQAELGYHRSRDERGRRVDVGRARESVANKLSRFGQIDLFGKRVLEVGCGPSGPINFVDATVRIGMDPLLAQYRKLKTQGYADPAVYFAQAVGEHLPLQASQLDVIICFNVLDHVRDPRATASEMARVLAPDGRLLLWLHVIKPWSVPLRPIFDRFDRGHPHHLTLANALDLLSPWFVPVRHTTEPLDGSGGNWKIRAARMFMVHAYLVLAKKGISDRRF